MESLTFDHLLAVYGIGHWLPYLRTAQGWVAWGRVHLWVVLLAAGGVWLMLIGVILMRRDEPRAASPTQSGYGTAHFATKTEVRAAGLARGDGIFVGRAHGLDLRVPRSHMLVIGPSECGKTVAIIAGLIAEWVGSVLTLDLKGEHYRLTADLRRRHGNTVHVFEPRHSASGHINLLDFVPFGPEEEVAAVKRVVDHLTFPGTGPQSGGAKFYRESNQRILEAVFLYLGNFEPPASFAKARSVMHDMMGLLKRMSETDYHLVNGPARSLLHTPRERYQLWSSAHNVLSEFDDPILARNTDDTTIDLSSLQFGHSPQTVYLRLTPDDARGSLSNFTRLLIDQHVAMAGQRRVVSDFVHHEALVLDDQKELGPLAAPDHVRAFYREHGLWCLSALQSFEQLGRAGLDDSALDNSKTWVIFPPQHTKSAQVVSEKLGTMTVQDVHTTRAPGQVRYTTVLHGRPLMTPFEVEHAPEYHAFVFRKGVPPLLVETVPFTHRRLRGVSAW